jgi:hypothetical protein
LSARRAILAAALAQARALAATLEAELKLLEADDARPGGDEVLGVQAARAHFRVGRATLLRGARDGELELMRGARGKLLVRRRDLEAFLARRGGKSFARPSGSAKRPVEPSPTAANDHDSRVAASLGLASGWRR